MFDVNTEDGTIRAYGLIGAFEDGITAVDFLAALDEMGGRDLTIHLQSEGGDVFDGLSIYNQIDNYPGQVKVVVDSLSASIASVLMMAADEIQANANAHVMVHNAWAMAVGNAEAFRGVADVLDSLDGQIASIYSGRTGIDAQNWLGIMGKDTYFDAGKALEMGLIDGVYGKTAKKASKAAAMRPKPRLAALDAGARARALRLSLTRAVAGIRK